MTTLATQCDPMSDIDAVNMREKLLGICKGIKEEEEKLNLLTTLQSKGLVTRDIMSFVNKQASIRTHNKWPDRLTGRRAMSAKISDAHKTLQWRRSQNRLLKNTCLRLLGNKKHKLNRWMKSIRQETNRKSHNGKTEKKYLKKIDHLSKIQKDMWRDKTPKYKASSVPHRLREYASLPIFKLPKDLPQPEELMAPFICHPTIKLNENELAILKKDPKFSLMEQCDEESFMVENELSNAKYRYGQQDRIQRKTRGEIKITTTDTSDKTQKPQNENISTDLMNLEALWAKESHKFTFNPFHKSLDFRHRRPTDYKLNKRVILPKPLDEKQEFFCEIKKRGFTDAFHKYEIKNKFKNESGPNGLKKKGKTPLPSNVIQSEKRRKENNKSDTNCLGIFQAERERGNKFDRNPTVEALKNKHSNKTTAKTKHKRKQEIFSNLNKKEQLGLNSLLKRVKNDEVRITPTDKSGRFAILTTEQYLDSGRVHTNKDEEIGWKEVNYLRNQVNNHMYWLRKIFRYCERTNPDRMNANLIVADNDLPEMAILIKDHKQWSFESKKPPPSRPIVSGNSTVNTHLSEFISEIIEPLALEADGAEIQSSEEALHLLDKHNERIQSGLKMNVLDNFNEQISYNSTTNLTRQDTDLNAQEFTRESKEIKYFSDFIDVNEGVEVKSCGTSPTRVDTPFVNEETIEMNNEKEKDESAISSSESGDISIDPEEVEDTVLIDVLTDLAREGGWLRMNEKVGDYTTVNEDTFDDQHEQVTQARITDFFSALNEDQSRPGDLTLDKWRYTLEQSHRDKFSSSQEPMKTRLEQGIKAGNFWANRMKSDRVNKHTRHTVDPTENIQDPEGEPIMIGCDVVGLYPNLDPINVAKITADTVRDTKVQFRGVDFCTLAIYLVLTLGESTMQKVGLSQCIPKRLSVDKGNPQSLSSNLNRNLENWDFSNLMKNIDEKLKKEMIACSLQVMVLLMTSTTCYRFGGKIFRQRKGLGIGLRGSAALARLVMCKWDNTWAALMKKSRLILLIFYRYVDDLRLCLRPLNKGWFWQDNEWIHDPERPDQRDTATRTIEEIHKSINSVWDFLEFTTESQSDFQDAALPTLDFKTCIKRNGYVAYEFFSKPMSRNNVLTYGTALSRTCIFSSLRQDLVRRLSNTDLSMGPDVRLKIVNQFIQLMINSGHKFQFIKAVILQALSKFVYMVERDALPPDHKRYSPLHRPVTFDSVRRKLCKYTEHATWYSAQHKKDIYSNGWKYWITTKEQWRQRLQRHKGSKILKNKNKIVNATVLFVPKTEGEKLLQVIQETEEKLSGATGWGTKIVEKPGTPLLRKFIKTSGMEAGCIRGNDCKTCKGSGTKCMMKNVVYQVDCKSCKQDSKTVGATYIGESSRQFGTRMSEHYNNLSKWKKESFMLNHWMECHPLSTTPPVFTSKVVSKHKDALSRQIKEAVLIRTRGNMNKKFEFASNEIVRLESKKYSWDQSIADREKRREEKVHDEKLVCFINVMRNVGNVNKRKSCDNMSDALPCSRLQIDQEVTKKRRMSVNTSTPVSYRQNQQDHSDSVSDTSGSTFDWSPEGNDIALGPGKAKDVKLPVDGVLKSLKLTPIKPENKPMTTARQTIAANETMDSTEYHRRRINSLPTRGSILHTPTLRLRPAISISGDITNQSLCCGELDGLEPMNVSPLAMDEIFQDFWVGEDGTYGLSELFLDQEELDEKETERLIRMKTKNQLCEIFLRTCRGKPLRYACGLKSKPVGGVAGALVTPGKRKASPQPEPHMNGNPTKAACQRLVKECIDRSNSISGGIGMSSRTKGKKSTRRRLSSMPTLDPRQQKLTNLWKVNNALE